MVDIYVVKREHLFCEPGNYRDNGGVVYVGIGPDRLKGKSDFEITATGKPDPLDFGVELSRAVHIHTGKREIVRVYFKVPDFVADSYFEECGEHGISEERFIPVTDEEEGIIRGRFKEHLADRVARFSKRTA
ncbi:hypothetical protein HOD38_01400 [archaeon]|jgi:hypothetical protein|nr:hypothetical protein [archaeon]MBT4441422.1 hypothetical protein [archaeon]